LEALRTAVGGTTPIAVTLDLHANVSERVARMADILVAYDTYPHVDFAERGREAAALLLRAIKGERFTRVLVQLPMVPSTAGQATEEQPMKDLIRAAHDAESSPGIEIVSWTP